MMFFCESALEAQRVGTRAAANKIKNKQQSPLLRARRATADARRGDGAGGEGEADGWRRRRTLSRAAKERGNVAIFMGQACKPVEFETA